MAYKGGHARREEIARSLGFKSNRERVAFRKAEPARYAARLAGAERKGAVRRGTSRSSASQQARAVAGTAGARRRHATPGGGEVVSTKSEREVLAALRRADAAGLRVRAIVTVRGRDGVLVDVPIWQKGGIDAGTAFDGADESGAFDYLADQASDENYAEYAAVLAGVALTGGHVVAVTVVSE